MLREGVASDEAGVPKEMLPTPPGGVPGCGVEGDGVGGGAVVLAIKKSCKNVGNMKFPSDGIAYSLFRPLYSSLKKRCSELALRE